MGPSHCLYSAIPVEVCCLGYNNNNNDNDDNNNNTIVIKIIIIVYLHTLAVSPSFEGSCKHKETNKNNGGYISFF